MRLREARLRRLWIPQIEADRACVATCLPRFPPLFPFSLRILSIGIGLLFFCDKPSSCIPNCTPAPSFSISHTLCAHYLAILHPSPSTLLRFSLFPSPPTSRLAQPLHHSTHQRHWPPKLWFYTSSHATQLASNLKLRLGSCSRLRTLLLLSSPRKQQAFLTTTVSSLGW